MAPAVPPVISPSLRENSKARNGPLAIYEPGNVSGFRSLEPRHQAGQGRTSGNARRRKKKRPPLGWPSNGGGGGTAVPSLSGGLDYAFILLPGCGACYPLARILVRAPRLPAQRVYESLQGRPEVGPLPTPRRCHAAFCGGNRVRRCEPRFHFALSGKGNLTDRTRVREP